MRRGLPRCTKRQALPLLSNEILSALTVRKLTERSTVNVDLRTVYVPHTLILKVWTTSMKQQQLGSVTYI